MSIAEIVGTLQKAIEMLESNPDSEASSVFARKALKISEKYSDFSLINERRSRIGLFLDHLTRLNNQPLQKGENDEQEKKELIYFPRVSGFDYVNLFERALLNDYKYDAEWDENTGSVKILDWHPCEMLIREGAYSSVWMTTKILYDILDYYSTNLLNEDDLDLIGLYLDVAKSLLDQIPNPSAESVELRDAYDAVVLFLQRNYVSLEGMVMELHIDSRFISTLHGKYNDEYILETSGHVERADKALQESEKSVGSQDGRSEAETV